MKSTKQLINNLAGQLNGINRMIDNNEDCLKILVQMKAVKAGIEAVMSKHIETELKECIGASNSKKDQEKLRKLFTEATKQ